ncbi:unnamed protein product [Fraxinus pennsylvanica]|uniref:DJ-1/PfpI domain-containing protein n=1 Tax=Fraxinus pennsylvanica TaxID=56036 RepID=A0AAD1YR24_9LAMI|nr:unnamed protein product [Fraxinus pennsylvanica]
MENVDFLVELSKSQDAGALLKASLTLLSVGIHSTIVSDALQEVSIKVVDILTAMAIPVELLDHDSLTYSELQGHIFALKATFDEIDATKYNGLIIPGGRAPEYLAMNECVVELVKKFSESRKPITSICHGRLTLAAAEPETGAFCTSDGNLITGAKYDGHPAFQVPESTVQKSVKDELDARHDSS